MMIFRKLNFWNGIKFKRVSALFFLAENSDSVRQSHAFVRQSERGKAPKAFSMNDKCLPVSGIFRRKTDG